MEKKDSLENKVFRWIQSQSRNKKIGLLALVVILFLLGVKLFISRHHYFLFFFLSSQLAHSFGIWILIYKLSAKKNCSGLSLKTQELTAVFLVVRLFCSLSISEIHTIVDFITLVPTIWVIYMMRNKLSSTYNKDLDDLPRRYVIVPTVVLALLVHPSMNKYDIDGIFWAFCSYVEAVSVMPQLRLMQNATIAEIYTAHYVFALGVSKFLGCAHWVIMIIETHGQYLFFWGHGSVWTLVNLFAEIVQTFILIDFCYYYVKRVMAGQIRLPLPI